MIRVMVESNRLGAEIMQEVGAHGCTDITGFGLLGHALEMASASKRRLVITASRVPVIPFAREYAQMGLVPGGTHANLNYCHRSLEVDPGIPAYLLDILSDAQTSGGLLIAAAPEKAGRMLSRLKEQGLKDSSLIGEVVQGPAGTIQILP
jgi:selenide,water dikinase